MTLYKDASCAVGVHYFAFGYDNTCSLWTMTPENENSPYFYATVSYSVQKNVADGYDGVQVKGLMYSDGQCTQSIGEGDGTLLLGYCQTYLNTAYYYTVVDSSNIPPSPDNRKLAVQKYYNTADGCATSTGDVEFVSGYSLNECVPDPSSQSGAIFSSGSSGLQLQTYSTMDCSGGAFATSLPATCANNYQTGSYLTNVISFPYPGWSPTFVQRAQSYVTTTFVDTTATSKPNASPSSGPAQAAKKGKEPPKAKGKGTPTDKGKAVKGGQKKKE